MIAVYELTKQKIVKEMYVSSSYWKWWLAAVLRLFCLCWWKSKGTGLVCYSLEMKSYSLILTIFPRDWKWQRIYELWREATQKLLRFFSLSTMIIAKENICMHSKSRRNMLKRHGGWWWASFSSSPGFRRSWWFDGLDNNKNNVPLSHAYSSVARKGKISERTCMVSPSRITSHHCISRAVDFFSRLEEFIQANSLYVPYIIISSSLSLTSLTWWCLFFWLLMYEADCTFFHCTCFYKNDDRLEKYFKEVMSRS